MSRTRVRRERPPQPRPGGAPSQFEADDACRLLHRFAELFGSPMGGHVYQPNGPTGECWTNAWNGPGLYVEGTCLRPGIGRGTHAWNLNPLGLVVERTPGYEDARDYVGVIIDRDGPLGLTSAAWHEHEPWRVSILEAAFYLGMPSAEAARQLRKAPA